MAESKPSRDAEAPPPRASGSMVLIVIGSCVLVALVAGGVRLVQPAIALDTGAEWAVRLLGAVLLAGGVTSLLFQRESLAPPTTGGADPSRVALTTAAATMIALALISVMAHPLATRPSSDRVPYVERPIDVAGSDTVPSPPPPPQLGLGLVWAGEDRLQEPDPASPTQIERISNDTRERVAAITRWILLLALGAAGVWFLARWLRRLGRDRSGAPVTRAQAEEGLEGSLLVFDVDGGDPREQITAAYHRLLTVLERAKVPREAYEAPHEHLDRVLGPLGIPPAPLHRLAGLYVRAHFGETPVTEQHRDEAIRSLNDSLAGLRFHAIESPDRSGRRAPSESRR